MSSGIRRALDKKVDQAIGSRHAEAIYLTGLFVASAVSWVLLKIGRHLSR